MHAARIIRDPAGVADRLSMFGVTAEEFIPLIEAVVAAKNDVVAVDARTASGSKAYFAGVRHKRLLFLPKGWEMDSTGGVESVYHPDTGIRIVYQSVDEACISFRGPQPVSTKGPASEAAIKTAQGELFCEDEAPEVPPERIARLNSTVWFLCVSINQQDPDDVRAELALPAAIDRGNFKGFLERIFIVNFGEWNSRGSVAKRPDDDDPYEFSIARK